MEILYLIINLGVMLVLPAILASLIIFDAVEYISRKK